MSCSAKTVRRYAREHLILPHGSVNKLPVASRNTAASGKILPLFKHVEAFWEDSLKNSNHAGN